MKHKSLSLSVHELVDFLLRTGSIDDRVFNVSSMTRGIALHTHYQSKQHENYVSEFLCEETFYIDDWAVTLRGFADGVDLTAEPPLVEEIKSTNEDIDHFHENYEEWHLGQAKCYALMIAHKYNFDTMRINLVYIQQETNEKRVHTYEYSLLELEEDIENYLEKYLNFYLYVYNHKLLRNESSKNIKFPFSYLRKGQKMMIEEVSKIVDEGGIALIEAPTGIGKTMAALYPVTTSFHQEKIEKIFYFTAKGSTQNAAYNAAKILADNNLEIKTILVTAKEKICLNDSIICNPDGCPFTKNYYSKLKDVLLDMFVNEEFYSRDTILKYALKYQICPFELQLDLSLYTDIIIADYNYLFDPTAYLRRFFDDGSMQYFTLIDEAHNLVNRVRDSYSITLNFYRFVKVKKELRKVKSPKFKRRITDIINEAKNINTLMENGETDVDVLCQKLDYKLEKFADLASEFMILNPKFKSEHLKELYFDVLTYLKLSEINEDYMIKVVRPSLNGELPIIRILCLDPQKFIYQGLLKSYGSVLFSATLGPREFYDRMLGIKEGDASLTIPTGFDKNNLSILVATDVATTYKKRDETYGEVVDYILAAIRADVGNYLVFCPSYAYLEKVSEYLETLDDFILIKQEKDMSEEARHRFLSEFKEDPKVTVVGLTVMGGIFAEGIDLPNDRLRGVVIIGVGFPRIDEDLKLISTYYEEKFNKRTAFFYTYVYPGINRILQAMGRVIRNENDYGFVLLIDKRYLERPYINSIRSYNGNLIFVDNPAHVSNELNNLYERIAKKAKKCDNLTSKEDK